ncbi:MAG TPA: hypothetical protein V6C84_15100 [Coleofasciculaceae cyanobacterium]
MSPIYPSACQLYLLALYQRHPSPLHPALFLQDWAMSYGELAQSAGVSLSTVEHWFSSGASHREPSSLYCRQLEIVHRLWDNADRITPEVIRLWCDAGKSARGQGISFEEDLALNL